ncbi:MAG: eIF2 kinase Gcn2p negative regulator [Pycnora praestabilis]|nr:MAG: eIF2 kinase Gcn2p negative regulator [Pycnora praestabilis]
MFEPVFADNMSEDLQNEVEAINSIYGSSTIAHSSENTYILSLPQQSTSLRLQFPINYPQAPLSVLGTQKSGNSTRKGDASHLLDIVRDVLAKVFRPGEVCLFDLLEEVGALVGEEDEQEQEPDSAANGGHEDITDGKDTLAEHKFFPEQNDRGLGILLSGEQPSWTLSEVISEKKSVFIARCANVTSLNQARSFLTHLLTTDKKVAKATHNITAWRIRGDHDVTFQDCDDDGETAAGGRVLHLMQLMDVWGVMVVVTRWYGGVHLGPDRFRIISSVARDAFVRAGYVKEQASSDGGKKKGKK